ncbi:MAG: polysaccharide biosynthesis/export family protein [bacterium]
MALVLGLGLFSAGCASDRLAGDRRLEQLLADLRTHSSGDSGAAPATAPAAAVSEIESPAAPLPRLSPVKITIQPETVVEITVGEDQSLTGTYEVNSASAIQFRYVGLVFLGNMTEEAAEKKIKNLLEKDRGFRAATVAVRIIKASYDTIRVSGWVNAETVLKIGPGSEIALSDALLRAGGLRAQAKGIRITIAREGLLNPIPLVGRTNEEYSLVGPDGKSSVPAVALRRNDWVHVSPGEEQVGQGEKQIVVMMMSQPSVVRFANNEPCTMMYLLVKIGALPKWVNSRTVLIKRKGQDGIETEIKVDIRKLLESGDPAFDVAIEHGDRVIFNERKLPFLP